MRLEEIKQAIAEGRKVYHGNKNYERTVFNSMLI